MRPNDLTPDDARTGGRPAQSKGSKPAAGRAVRGADRQQLRRLERAGGWTRRERLRVLWFRLRLTVQEMNYAQRRLTELRTRWPE
jgi:hypothetical protein